MARVLLAGVAVADFVFQVADMPAAAEKYRAEDAAVVGGGCAANAAVAVARQGGEPLLAARLGADPVGDLIIAGLVEEGVDVSLVDRAPGGLSSFSSVYVDRAGERQIMNFRGRGLRDDAGWLDRAPQVDAVLADNRWTPLAVKALAIARQRGIPGVLDGEAPVEPEAFEGASHIAFSRQGLDDFLPSLDTEEALRHAAQMTGAWICVTDGEAGVSYLDGGVVRHVPAVPIKVVDTLAAGDIWHGVFALRLAEGADEHEAIVHANAAAALKCARFGGRRGCPDRETTNRFRKENGLCN